MRGNLRASYQVHRLAVDLGLAPGADPVAAILDFCTKKIRRFLREFKCESLPELLEGLATHLGTLFVEIRSDDDLLRVKQRYLNQAEKALVTLEKDLAPDVFAITYRLLNRKRWQRPYLSIIDCRGEKGRRSYFSKWHELAHLLTLTDQMRLSFMRTHCQTAGAGDPEEAMMEVIAGTFGFWPEIIARQLGGRISFNSIERIRRAQFPEASFQAAMIGIVKAWPSPYILVHADMGLKRSEEVGLSQKSFSFGEEPCARLRAVKVTTNLAARQHGLQLHQNMRIPDCSIITRVFLGELTEGEAVENLGRWTTSSGRGLSPIEVIVLVRKSWSGVDALICPSNATQKVA